MSTIFSATLKDDPKAQGLIREWIRALRSGDYTQGDSALRSDQSDGGFGYCCLGVLCDLVDPQHWSLDPFDNGEVHAYTHPLGADDQDDWVGRTPGFYLNANGRALVYLTRDGQTELAERNDGSNAYEQHDFGMIANVLEQNFSKVLA